MKTSKKGFTLLEMLLVMVIISAILIMIVGYTTNKMDQFKREKTALQMQQILNAALAYYVNTGSWPLTSAKKNPCNDPATAYITGSPGVDILTTAGAFGNYLPGFSSSGGVYKNAYGNNFVAGCTTNGLFVLSTQVDTTGNIKNAPIIAGMLPAGLAGRPNDTSAAAATFVTTQVQIPGQNLNNARSMNFGGIYHSGACVPVPQCPASMSPQILVSSASISGVSNPPSNCTDPKDFTTCSYNTYPVSSHNVYVTGGNTGMAGTDVPACTNGTAQPCMADLVTNTEVPAGTNYWRVCLQIASQDQVIQVANTTTYTPAPTGNCATQDCSVAWGQSLGSVVAITRCQPGPSTAPTENAGSNFTVWQQ